ncbi:MAG: YkgJ family cysteine cluster protein [PVC group bacterium]|nr:YkgJ family cysteine cluster protein [PVC group bacterium]
MSNRKKTSKEDCTGCPSICCHNLALQIGRPTNRAEIDDLKWQLHFNTVKVYIRSHRWYQWVEGKCIYLTDEGLCSTYETRPDKCRIHNPPDCELHGKFYDVMFSRPEELEAYFSHKRKKKKAQ